MKLLRYALAGGVLLASVVAINRILARQNHRRSEQRRDEALEDSFPASDPPGTQDFSSPDDRLPKATADRALLQ